MKYASGPMLGSLAEAILWVESRWDRQRTAPSRLHDAHTTEGELGAPRFSGAFAAALDGAPDATERIVQSIACGHPDRKLGQLCGMCAIVDDAGLPMVESGVYQHQVDRYQYPMTRALLRLSNSLQPRSERGRIPHPYRVVLVLASYGWDARRAAAEMDLGWDMAEALMLRSLRQLHRWYAEAPTPRVGWVDKSEAQQAAETWTAA